MIMWPRRQLPFAVRSTSPTNGKGALKRELAYLQAQVAGLSMRLAAGSLPKPGQFWGGQPTVAAPVRADPPRLGPAAEAYPQRGSPAASPTSGKIPSVPSIPPPARSTPRWGTDHHRAPAPHLRAATRSPPSIPDLAVGERNAGDAGDEIAAEARPPRHRSTRSSPEPRGGVFDWRKGPEERGLRELQPTNWEFRRLFS